MNASDISKAISAMNKAHLYILDHVDCNAVRNDLLADLAMASHPLISELRNITVKIKESEIA